MSFLPADQNSLLAALPEISENQVFTGFDSLRLLSFVRPVSWVAKRVSELT